MLTITIWNKNTAFWKKNIETFSWRVGEKNPLYMPGTNILNNISWIEVSADGKELEYIRQTMRNLPDTNQRAFVHWYGDHARFIACNLTE